MRKTIAIKGARENNLRGIDVEIPRDQLTVITGVSGSGKSSLAFDVIYGEGQRRFLESLSTYAKKYIPQVKKAKVDFVFGLSPVVAIEQKTGIQNPRSTVGTMTDIYDYLRLLFSTVGIAHCPKCNHEIPIKTPNQIAERILSLPKGTTVEILAPIYKIYNEDYEYIFDEVRKKGYKRFRINGKIYNASDDIKLDEYGDYEIEAVIDRFIVKGEIYKQLVLSLESGFKVGEGFLRIEVTSNEIEVEGFESFYKGLTCSDHHIVMCEPSPSYFSFNDAESACPTCYGLGSCKHAEPALIVINKEKSISKGALSDRIYNLANPHSWRNMIIESLLSHYGFSIDTPFKELSEEVKNILFYGTRGEKFKFLEPEGVEVKYWLKKHVGQLFTYEGILSDLDRWYKRARKKQELSGSDENLVKKVMVEHICPDCHGTSLKKQRLLVTIGGKNIHELGTMALDEFRAFLNNISIVKEKRDIAEPIISEIKLRVDLLLDIGLYYMNINRRADTISGGETQRIRLSTQISSGLMGMMYVLDEPSIGLHPRDGHKVINTLKKLRDTGNTVIVVEHDIDTISEADHIIEVGPGPGIHGGRLVAQGSIDEIKSNAKSLTGQFLNGSKKIDVPSIRRISKGQSLIIEGARENNLKHISVNIPLGVFVCITGVSGSGKSTLVNEILYKKLQSIFQDARIIPGKHKDITGYECINNAINIDQTPIGKMPTSNPATYVGFFNKIRKIFASLPEAIEMDYSDNYFSFNTKGGRCEECKGYGVITKELHFMPDIETVCPVCKGARYNNEILEIKYKGKNISEVLEMSVEEAIEFFREEPYINHKLKVLEQLGLGYIKLGQPSPTLSGGEAQRIKLATELGKIKSGGHKLYILDEPTTGLHLADIQRLMDCLNKLVDAGNTVLVIEHHIDVIKSADYIIDLGPDGGRNGGQVVACGTPEEVAEVTESYTGQYLRGVL